MTRPDMTIREVEPGYFTVTCGHLLADKLCHSEALAVVAHHLMTDIPKPPFMKTYAQWSAFEQRYGDPVVFKGVLTHQVQP